MFRYFCKDEDIHDDSVTICGSDVRHLVTILRKNVGDSISVVTESKEYTAVISAISKDDIVCNITVELEVNNETHINVTLCQGVPKQTKMETIIQQNVEVGIKKFIPLITERTIVKLDEKDRELKKIDRWRKIAKESAKQSRRNMVPDVCGLMTIRELVNKLRDENVTIIVPYEEEHAKTLKEVLKEPGDDYYIVIGPEGGFDVSEIEMLRGIGAHIVTLGSRILRTETAGVVTAAVILYACDEMV